MNKVILIGRLVRDPECRYSAGAQPMEIAKYTLAVDRRFKSDEQAADFISCIAFGKLAEHAEKYYKKGLKVVVEGHIQTGSYTNKNGQKIYTTDVIVEAQEFAESKGEKPKDEPKEEQTGFSDLGESDQLELPFN